jgi:predicted nuclease with TOPRIM domain
MDDDFTTGPKDDQFLAALKTAQDNCTTHLREFRYRVDERLRTMQLDLREMSVTLAAMNRILQRRAPDGLELSPDKQALLDLRRDHASLHEMYALAQTRMDRMEARISELERRTEPPLPPFPEFKPKP